ncbi:asparaginase domain-containing protein [Streptomyces sp. NPDC018019]|uniref:asparaginase domain-containing protein n=1 Tax=Streptomyces sp. NPDC018019 TaxID=3365030 RepID=UPI003787E3B2
MIAEGLRRYHERPRKRGSAYDSQRYQEEQEELDLQLFGNRHYTRDAGPAASRGGTVLTTGMRSLDEPCADGPRNLAAAVTAAVDPVLVGAGAVLCVDGRLHAARWVTHTDATGGAGFSSAPYSPLGRVRQGRVEPLAPPPTRPPATHGSPSRTLP